MSFVELLRRRWLRVLIGQLLGAGLFFVGIWLIPHRWCAREAPGWYAGDRELQESLARGVEGWVEAPLTRAEFSTGHDLFNGEWLFGTYMMAGLGFGQVALEHPELAGRHAQLMDTCIERMLSPEVRAFDRTEWGEDPIESLAGDSDHAAFLGYFNLLLSMRRLVGPGSPHAELSDRVTAALVRRVERSPTLLLETYPGECYPVDNCAVIGSIGLYDKATGADHGALVRRWSERCRQKYLDPASGLLIQAVAPKTGEASDEPRGSGTCLGLYFLSFADEALSRDMYAAVKRELAGTVLGFGAVREYPRGAGGGGDIDSGGIVAGYSVSATGFSIAGSRMHGDHGFFRRLTATAYCAGAPVTSDGRRNHLTGGPVGDAILFAMLTAQPPARLSRKGPGR